jgi:hypothetical protein
VLFSRSVRRNTQSTVWAPTGSIAAGGLLGLGQLNPNRCIPVEDRSDAGPRRVLRVVARAFPGKVGTGFP